MSTGKDSIYGRYIKRMLDFVFALIILVLFCWVYAILALLVRVKMGSPVIYASQRPGRIDPRTGKERIFWIYKFRSMTNAKDENGQLLPGAQRLTKFGRKLRATSLDELPELFNILKGDMSFVGPRPQAMKNLPYYTEKERHRHDVRPGLTGWAQVNGRNNISWEEKFAYDLEYVNNLYLAFDVRIIFTTVIKVLRHEGIGQGEEQPVSLHKQRAVK